MHTLLSNGQVGSHSLVTEHSLQKQKVLSSVRDIQLHPWPTCCPGTHTATSLRLPPAATANSLLGASHDIHWLLRPSRGLESL